MPTELNQRGIAGNTATGLLKILALVFMLIDHLGASVFGTVTELRIIGRMAFPLYCWCMVVGFCHTRSVPKYLLRLLLIGLVSQPLYMVALNHPLTVYNIFLTLLLGLLGLWGLRSRRWLSHIWAPVLVLLAADWLSVSYGWYGVMLIWLLYAARTSRPAIAAVMIIYCLSWGTISPSMTVYEIGPFSLLPMRQWDIYKMISPWLKLQSMAILSLPLMLIRMPWKLRMPAWISYALYPLHLALLIVIQLLMDRPVHWDHLTQGWETICAACTGVYQDVRYYVLNPLQVFEDLWGWICAKAEAVADFFKAFWVGFE